MQVSFASELYAMWGNKTAREAHDVLAKPDVVVTNASDKEEQLPKLLRMDELVKRSMRSLVGSAEALDC